MIVITIILLSSKVHLTTISMLNITRKGEGKKRVQYIIVKYLLIIRLDTTYFHVYCILFPKITP